MGRSCLRARACRPGRWAEAAPTTTVQVPATSSHGRTGPKAKGLSAVLACHGPRGARARSRATARLRARTGTATERRRNGGGVRSSGPIDSSTTCPKGFTGYSTASTWRHAARCVRRDLHERCPGTRMHSTSASENDSTAATERRRRAIQRTHRLQHKVSEGISVALHRSGDTQLDVSEGTS